MRWMVAIGGLAAVMGAVWALSPAPSATGGTGRDQSRLVVTGSSTVAPLLGEIAKHYEVHMSAARVDVQTGGSARGITDVRQGLADIGMVSRTLKDNESDLHAYPIARDGIGLIVHADNPLSDIRTAQVQAIYTGAVTHWRELGGLDQPTTVVHKAEGRSTLELFLAHFGLHNTDVRPHMVIGDNAQGIKAVAGNRAAIGYVSIGAAEYAIEQGTPIKLLSLDGKPANSGRVRAGDYPLTRTLTLVTSAPAAGVARRFIDYLLSEQARDVVVGQYFAPLAP